jgi:hypothetical protein
VQDPHVHVERTPIPGFGHAEIRDLITTATGVTGNHRSYKSRNSLSIPVTSASGESGPLHRPGAVTLPRRVKVT